MQYEESNERKRLSGQLTARGTQSGLPVWGLLLFGLPFAVMGGVVMLAGLKVLPVNPKSVHAPFWILTAFGSLFVVAGLFLWSKALQQYRANRRPANITGDDNAAVAMRDYLWNPRGSQPSRFGNAFKTGISAIFFTLFLSAFNWWAFGKHGPLLLVVIVAIFDAILAFIWAQFFLILSRAIRFSSSRIEFTQFPYSPGQPIVIRWQADGISQPSQGSFTLRCVQEWWEVSGTGKNRSRRLVQESAWSGAWKVGSQDQLAAGKHYEFKFQPPADAPSTSLGSNKVFFWEFAVELEMSGPDFVESYLVPVYRADRPAVEIASDKISPSRI